MRDDDKQKVVSFHGKEQAALTFCDAVEESHPALAPSAQGFKSHYLHGGIEKPSAYLLQAALYLLTSENYSRAASAFSSKLRIHIIQAEKHVIDAVNQGPDFLKADEDFLHEKGIMRGSSRYFLGSKNIELGSIYDTAWKAMDRSYRPIIADALEGTMKKHKIIPMKVMKYVAASLMPEDDLKYVQLNKLSMLYGKEQNDLMKEAASFIRSSAKKHGIEIPETMLGGLLSPKKAPYERVESLPTFITKPAAVLPSHAPANTLRDDFTEEVAAQETPAPFKDAASDIAPELLLKRRLEKLEKRGEISSREHKVYYFLHTEGKNGPRFTSDAVDYLRKHEGVEKGERVVQIMVANVNMKLKAFEAANDGTTPASNGDRHQSRAVRPE